MTAQTPAEDGAEARIRPGMTPAQIAGEVTRAAGPGGALAVAAELLAGYARAPRASAGEARAHLASFAAVVAGAAGQLAALQLAARDQWRLGWGTIAAAAGLSRSTLRDQVTAARSSHAARGTWFDPAGEHHGTPAEAARQAPGRDDAG